MALWYFSYIIKGNVRSARSWVRCTVRLLICLHMCQIFINVFQTMIYQPRVNQNSLKCSLYGQTLPLRNLTGGYHSDLQDHGVAVSISVAWASGVERGEVLSGEIFLLFACFLVWLFKICSSISTLLNTAVSVN